MSHRFCYATYIFKKLTKVKKAVNGTSEITNFTLAAKERER
jgi:hypothetical protein